MKQIHKYLVFSFLKPFALTFTLSMIVLILNFLWLYVDELVGKGLGIEIIGEVFLSAMAGFIPNALILGILLASVMAFGNLGEHNELTAMKSSGISLKKLLYPLMLVVFGLGILSAALSNYLIPKTNLNLYSLMYDIRALHPDFEIVEGQFYNGIDGYSLYIGDKSKDGNTLYNLMIYDHSLNEGNVSVTTADSAFMGISEDTTRLLLTLFNGRNASEQLSNSGKIQDTKPFRRDSFEMQQMIYTLPGSELIRSSDSAFRDRYKVLNMGQLIVNARDQEKYLIWMRNKLGHELIEQHYLVTENKKQAREDPLYYEAPVSGTDPGSLIWQLSEKEQLAIYKEAGDLARNVQVKLKKSREDLVERIGYANRYRNELHRMLVNAFACLLFLLIGAPLGAYIRTGGLGTPVLVSIIIFLLYFVISITGEKYARVAQIPSWLGMWSAIIALLPFAIYLIIKSNNDSRIFNQDKLENLFNQPS